jgi:hypothetical protein
MTVRRYGRLPTRRVLESLTNTGARAAHILRERQESRVYFDARLRCVSETLAALSDLTDPVGAYIALLARDRKNRKLRESRSRTKVRRAVALMARLTRNT